MWVNVKKDNQGQWRSRGTLLTAFETDWAEGEPKDAAGADCAIISRSAGYKMKAENCLSPYKFFCMAQAPNCPLGFTWVPAYGKGSSCFKFTPMPWVLDPNSNTLIAEYMLADKMCLKEGFRMAAPQTKDDMDALTAWTDDSPFVDDQNVAVVFLMNFPSFDSLFLQLASPTYYSFMAGMMYIDPTGSNSGDQTMISYSGR